MGSTPPRAGIAYFRYRLIKNKLLKKRDNYIAKRIDETLNHGETGILFMGSYHNIIPRLPKTIQIIELRETKKIRDYQRLLLHPRRDEHRFQELAKYLVCPLS